MSDLYNEVFKILDLEMTKISVVFGDEGVTSYLPLHISDVRERH